MLRSLVCGFLAAALVAPTLANAADRPHVVVVVWDTTRPDALTPYGARHDTTPTLAALAKDGVVFDQAYSTSHWTLPSVASLFTGLFVHNHQVSFHAPVPGAKVQPYTLQLPDAAITLAEVMKGAGYATGLFTAQPILDDRKSFAQGFDKAFKTEQDAIVAEGLRFLDAAGDTPTFTVLYWHDPHAPYTPDDAHDLWDDPALPKANLVSYEHDDLDRLTADEGWMRMGDIEKGTKSPSLGHYRQLRNHYDGELRANDDALAELWKGLTERGIADDVVFAFVSDHGESFGEHRFRPVGHRYPWDVVARVPLVIRAPGKLKPERVGTMVRAMDLMPTLLELVGVSLHHEINARSLLPVVAGTETEARPVVGYAHAMGAPVWYRDGAYKLIGMRLGDPRWKLFDVRGDPGEKTNLAETMPHVLSAYIAKIDELTKASTISLGPAQGATEAEKAALEALGYIE